MSLPGSRSTMPIMISTWQIYFLINGWNQRVRKNPTKVNENLRIFGVALTNPGVILTFAKRESPKAYLWTTELSLLHSIVGFLSFRILDDALFKPR